ncbi:MAG: class II aldolase/adducin family protein [Methanobacterium sp.]|uniref:class II aldolase/adducin family protein n=1 Tax=Methanobacterium sp. TaxID=2164 RepID=UPI003D660A24|nr:class II aldolase/adducin family protein [Methanobacterium sp.]
MDKNVIIKELINVSHYIYKKGLSPGKSGNLSCRFYDNNVSKVAITRSGISKGRIQKEDVIIIDMDGNILEGDKKPSLEMFMHLGIYKERNDINSVVHNHSPFATGFSMSDKRLKRLEGFGPIENPYIPSVKYSKPGSIELAEDTAKMMKNEDAVLLKNHGVVAAGVNLDEAVLLAEFVEDIAKIQFVAQLL